ncbi:MAG: hypothetical protein AB1742_11990, partial [bacterium]
FFVYPLIQRLHGGGGGKTAWLVNYALLGVSCFELLGDRNAAGMIGGVAGALFGTAREEFIVDAQGVGWAATALLTLSASTFVLVRLMRPATALFMGTLGTAFFFTMVWAKGVYMEEHRYDWYAGHFLARGWSALDANVKRGARIAYAGNSSPYGLYGSRLMNDVLYVNVDGSDKNFHDYARELAADRRVRRPGEYRIRDSLGLFWIFRGERDFRKWYAALLRKEVDYLFVSRHFYRGIVETTVEEAWAEAEPELFRLKFHDGDIRIYEVTRRGP